MLQFKTSQVDVALLGEVMVELAASSGDEARIGVAGDTYNTAVALAQLGLNAQYFTALGDCVFSERVRAAIDTWGVDSTAVVAKANTSPGLYAIVNDDAGERSFCYWRDNSAAKQWLGDLAAFEAVLPQMAEAAAVYWSGITLALMSTPVRERFLSWLAAYRAEGGVVCFDSNYRPRLWAKGQDVCEVYEQAIAAADIYLPSIEDGEAIHGQFDINVAKGLVQRHSLSHVVITDNHKAIWLSNDTEQEIALAFADSIQDATGAGDAFSGGLLAALLKGAAMPEAVQFAHQVASQVVQVKGAILPHAHWVPLAQCLQEGNLQEATNT